MWHRAPHGRQEFSSLMFLSPSPPRLTRRSRLTNIVLLILRALAVILVVAAAVLLLLLRVVAHQAARSGV